MRTWILALAALTVAVYFGVWSFEFVQFDDPTYVVMNPNVASGLTWSGVRWAFTTGYASNWHPLTWLSHMLDVTLFGLAAGPAHAVNLALHATSVVLLFVFLARLTGAAGRSVIVAALFAVHPLHVESVAWISERKDVLSGVFWILTMLAYVQYVRQPSRWRYAAVAVCFALGLMAKPMLVTLPFALILLDIWPLGRAPIGGVRRSLRSRMWPLVREKLPLLALAAIASIVTFTVQHGTGAVMTLDRAPLWLRVENALVSDVRYLVMTVWPAGLCAYYPHPSAIPLWMAAGAAILLAAITLAAVKLSGTRPYVIVGWLWYIGTLVPVIGLVQVGRQALADRYMYIPSIGLFIAIVWGAADWLARLAPRRIVAVVTATAAIAACAITARAQTGFWRNDSELFTRALAVDLDLDDRRARLAADDLVADTWFPALQALLEAREGGRLSLTPAAARYELGRLFLRHNQTLEAVESFTDATRLDPAAPAFHRELGLALSKQGRSEAAVAEYREAIRLSPTVPETQNDLGVLLAGLGRYTDAIPHFIEAVRLKPDQPDAHRNLGLAYATVGRVDDAIREFRDVLRLKPDDTTVRRVLDELVRRGKLP